MESECILVKYAEADDMMEVPIEKEKNLVGKATLTSAFPGSHGLKYINPKSGASRALMMDSEGLNFLPPEDGWTGKIYTIIFAPSNGGGEAKRRKLDDSIENDVTTNDKDKVNEESNDNANLNRSTMGDTSMRRDVDNFDWSIPSSSSCNTINVPIDRSCKSINMPNDRKWTLKSYVDLSCEQKPKYSNNVYVVYNSERRQLSILEELKLIKIFVLSYADYVFPTKNEYGIIKHKTIEKFIAQGRLKFVDVSERISFALAISNVAQVAMSGSDSSVENREMYKPKNPISTETSEITKRYVLPPLKNSPKIPDPSLKGSAGAPGYSINELNAHECLICLRETFDVHYGTVACRPCAAFFRRQVCHNRSHPDDPFKCFYNNQCEADQCKVCKYRYCIEAGMDEKKVLATPMAKDETAKNLFTLDAINSNNSNARFNKNVKPNVTYNYEIHNHFGSPVHNPFSGINHNNLFSSPFHIPSNKSSCRIIRMTSSSPRSPMHSSPTVTPFQSPLSMPSTSLIRFSSPSTSSPFLKSPNVMTPHKLNNPLNGSSRTSYNSFNAPHSPRSTMHPSPTVTKSQLSIFSQSPVSRFSDSCPLVKNQSGVLPRKLKYPLTILVKKETN